MDVGLRHLQFAVAAVRHGSLRRAAEALHLKQSTLSRGLRQFEERLGVVLFIRSSGGVRATSAGLELVATAERLLGDFDGLLADAGALGRGTKGHIALGLPTSHAVAKLCQTLIAYGQRYPEIDIRLSSRPKSALLADLCAGALDVVVITGRVASEGIETISLWSDQIFLAVPATHSLIEHGYATWTDIAKEIVLISTRGLGPELKEILSIRLGIVGRKTAIEEHAVGGDALLSLVAAGRGVSLHCGDLTWPRRPGYELLEVHDETGPASITYSACWMKRRTNPATSSFLELIRTHRSTLARTPET